MSSAALGVETGCKNPCGLFRKGPNTKLAISEGGLGAFACASCPETGYAGYHWLPGFAGAAYNEGEMIFRHVGAFWFPNGPLSSHAFKNAYYTFLAPAWAIESLTSDFEADPICCVELQRSGC